MAVMQRRRLLVLASTYPARAGDGTPAFVRDLAAAESSRYETTVLVPSVPGSVGDEVDGALDVRRFRFFPRRWEDLADGAILENLRSRKSRWLQVPAFLLAEVLAVRRLVRSIQPDVLHVHWLIPQGLAALVAAPRVPKLVTTLGGDLYGLRDPLSRRLIRLVLANSAAVTTMNSEMRDKLIGLGADPAATHVLPMGADVEMIRPLAAASERQPNRILFVGRLVEKKGFQTLVAGAARVRGPVSVRIVGAGVERTALERAIHDHDATRRVQIVGPRSHQHLPEDYAWADVVAVPSVVDSNGDRDGLPNVALEAMASGRPLVVSDVSDLGSTVQAARSGVVVPPGDSQALAEALDTLRAPALRAALATAGRRHVEAHFDLAACTRRFVEHLDALHVRQSEGADV